MGNPQIITLGIDLYALGYVIKYPEVNEQKTFDNDKLITNSFDIDVNNFDNFFSIDNIKSPFNSQNWRYSDIVINNSDGFNIFTGIIIDIKRNHNSKTAKILCKNTLFQFRNFKFEYESADWETPADAFINICALVNFSKYSTDSVATAKYLFETNNCYIKLNINKSDNINFQGILEKLGAYSCSDIYLHNNLVYFLHYNRDFINTTIKINETDLLSISEICSNEKDLINNYEIDYYNCIEPATDNNSNNIGYYSRLKNSEHELPALRGKKNEQIVIKDKVSATYIGDKYITRTHKLLTGNCDPLTKITFNVQFNKFFYLNISDLFKFTFSPEGWIEKIFEVYEITKNEEDNIIEIIAYEVIT